MIALVGLTGACATGAYAVRPDLVPGGFHGVDVLLVLAGWSTVRRLRDGRALPTAGHAAAVVAAICVMAAVAAVVLERGANRTHDALGILAAITGSLNWVLQSGFEVPGSYATIVQNLWLADAVAQLALVTTLLLLLLARTAPNADRAAIRLAAVAAVLSFAYAATPGVYLPFNGYFAFASRGWEFAIGCLVALVAARARDPRGRLGGAVALVGLAGTILCAFVVPPSATNNASWWAIPLVACAVAMTAGAEQWERGLDSNDGPLLRALAALPLPLSLTPGIVVGALLYVTGPIWIPGSNVVRDISAVLLSLLSAVVALVFARVLTGAVRSLRLRSTVDAGALRERSA
ncbi:hypothetical protein [uncultured Amnibacterium sp.]|uniref:hypothetical protein n=1 Tax=uncultured Amnibacterium sp. TaxID=1631851 RepID=UPI0035CC10F0